MYVYLWKQSNLVEANSAWKEDAEEKMDEIKLERNYWKILESLKTYNFDLFATGRCRKGQVWFWAQ